VRLRPRLFLLAVCVIAAACGRGLTREYEYEEQIDLALDGSATVVVNASIPALVALRGFALDPRSRARFDRAALAVAYASPGVHVVRIGQPWFRHGRRFVQVRLAVDDIRRLGGTTAFGWASCQLTPEGEGLLYRETVGPAAGAPVGDVGWTGREIVAFRIHMPSRIRYHNVRDLESGAPGEVERGNLLTWEQRLEARLRGVPLKMEARIDRESILGATLWVFGLSSGAALLVLAAATWWAARKGRRGPPVVTPP
jgi:hypothetical protein